MNSPSNLVFEDVSGCLIVRVSGRAMIENTEATMRAIAETARVRTPKAILVDMRSITGPITFIDRFKVGEFAGKHLAGFVLAALMREEQTDPKRIGQLAALNRGARVEGIFTDEPSALAWLGKYFQPQG